MDYPFILFDSDLDKCINFHFDLCITIYTRKASLESLLLSGIPDKVWVSYFNENFVEGSTHTQSHMNVMNEIYVPRLPGVQKFELR